jgi:hypothetical protein
MPIRNAVHLLNAIESDSKLREGMYSCNDQEEFDSCLNSNGYIFDYDEFEDAVHYLHLRCKTIESVQCLFHKAEWLRYLLIKNKKNSEVERNSEYQEKTEILFSF